MKQCDIKKLDRFTCKDPAADRLGVNVYLVSLANFNDERLIEWREFPLSELIDKPPVWFDPYLGRKSDSKQQIAFIYMEGRDVYFLVDGGSEIKLQKAERYSVALTDDYDKYNIIAMHVK